METLIAARKERHDAWHVYSAYVLFGSPSLKRPSDNDEPAETAGLPVSDLLRTASLCNTLVMVTRYLGGIKLGTDGLVRAYMTTTEGTFEQVVIMELLSAAQLSLTVDYDLYRKIFRLTKDCASTMLSLNFLAEISLCLLFRAEDSARLLAALTELSSGSLIPDGAETPACIKQDRKLALIQLSAC